MTQSSSPSEGSVAVVVAAFTGLTALILLAQWGGKSKPQPQYNDYKQYSSTYDVDRQDTSENKFILDARRSYHQLQNSVLSAEQDNVDVVGHSAYRSMMFWVEASWEPLDKKAIELAQEIDVALKKANADFSALNESRSASSDQMKVDVESWVNRGITQWVRYNFENGVLKVKTLPNDTTSRLESYIKDGKVNPTMWEWRFQTNAHDALEKIKSPAKGAAQIYKPGSDAMGIYQLVALGGMASR